ncbi:MAG: response regulator [Chloroflexota bacterium]
MIQNFIDRKSWILFASIGLISVTALIVSNFIDIEPLFWIGLGGVFLGGVGLIGSIWQAYSALFQDSKTKEIDLAQALFDKQSAQTAEFEQRQLAEALREIGLALSATLDFDELLEQLLDQIFNVLRYDTANIMLVDGEEINIVCTRGYKERAPYAQQFLITEIPSLQKMRESGQPLVIPNTGNHPLWVKPETSPHVRSWAGAPISVQGELVAFLALNYSQPDIYQPTDIGRLEAFAAQAAIAIQNTRFYEQIQRRYEEQSTLNTIGQAVSSTLDLQKTLTIVTDNVTRLLQVDATSVVLLDEKQNDLWFAAASGEASEFVLGQRLQLGQGIMGWVFEHGENLLLENVATDKRYYPGFDNVSGFKARSAICVPLKRMGETIGAIEVLNKKNGRFTEEDVHLLTLLTTPAASAIQNAQLYEQAQNEIQNRLQIEADLEAERALLAKRVEERTADLSSANAELARAARLKDEFLASISHELRTPLNAVLGISEALQEGVYGDLNENQVNSLRSIEESGRHLLSLINDILDLSKVEAGKLDLEIRPCSLKSIAQSSMRLMRQNALKKNLQMSLNYDESVEAIHADERRIKQILVNLLGNAIKFTPHDGSIGMDVEGDIEKKQVHVTVWDTGIGIAKEDMTRLFRPFIQLDSRLSREYAGTGLGLSLVYRMVELHGGSVSVESQVGKGSQFTVSFPWQGPVDQFSPIEQADLVAADAPRLQSYKRALIVEDSPSMTSQFIRYFSELGIETSTSMQGYGAVEKALVEQPDVIILDIMLPDISGWEILRQLKSEPPLKKIPVLVVSAIDDIGRALDLGASAILEKPINRQELQAALRQMLVNRIKKQTDRLIADMSQITAVSPSKVLLVEDNETNIQTISDYLSAKNFEISVVRSGNEVVESALHQNPDVILMDIQLPKRNGLDVIKEIRQIQSLASVPIIAVTALAMPGDQEACLRAGANAYISKPVILKEMVELIKGVLNENGSTITHR